MPQERRFKIRPAPVVVTRSLAAPRKDVWRAWSTAKHLRHWFAPDGFTVSAAEVDFRIGGAFSLHLLTPERCTLVSRGEYTDIVEPDRLGFRSRDGKFSCETVVTFADQASGTLLTIHQEYEVYAPGFLAVAAGATDAWRTTLDKLDTEMGRMHEALPA